MVESLRINAKVVYAASVISIRLLKDTKWGPIYEAVLQILHVFRSHRKVPPSNRATIQYSGVSDLIIIGVRSQFTLKEEGVIVVFAPRFKGRVSYLMEDASVIESETQEGIRMLKWMGEEELRQIGANEEKRRVQIELYEEIAEYFSKSKSGV